MRPLRVDRMDAERFRTRPIERQLHEPPRFEVLADDEVRLADETLAIERRQSERIAIIGPDRAADRHPDSAVLPEIPELARSRRRQRVAKAIVVREVGDGARPA